MNRKSTQIASMAMLAVSLIFSFARVYSAPKSAVSRPGAWPSIAFSFSASLTSLQAGRSGYGWWSRRDSCCADAPSVQQGPCDHPTDFVVADLLVKAEPALDCDPKLDCRSMLCCQQQQQASSRHDSGTREAEEAQDRGTSM